MFRFTDAERIYLTEMHSLATDTEGNEVLVGLTLEETAFLMEHRRKFAAGDRDRENRARARELSDRHQVARLQVVGAIIEKTNFSPTSH